VTLIPWSLYCTRLLFEWHSYLIGIIPDMDLECRWWCWPWWSPLFQSPLIINFLTPKYHWAQHTSKLKLWDPPTVTALVFQPMCCWNDEISTGLPPYQLPSRFLTWMFDVDAGKKIQRHVKFYLLIGRTNTIFSLFLCKFTSLYWSGSWSNLPL